jgi:hypothetical protein
MPAEIQASVVKERWDRIRANKKCDLSLSPETVADYLRKPEFELVQDRISETLRQLAAYRLEKGSFRSSAPPGPGDLVTCEGLESFLVPAVEGAFAFSAFLKNFLDSGNDLNAFVTAIVSDITGLVDRWEKAVFSAQPYANEDSILQALPPNVQEKMKVVNVTEAAAMACRVLVHLLTLKLNPSAEEVRLAKFRDMVGARLDESRMFGGLANAIDFLVRAFQKGDGETEEIRIAQAQNGGDAGSGWSWTDRPQLPPMLFFTASAVDAFAELDLYVIRKSADGSWEAEGNEDQKKLAGFYRKNAAAFEKFQLCVEMARLWVQNSVLGFLCIGSGQLEVPGLEPRFDDKKQKEYDTYQQEISREDLEHNPLVFYNNLYALQILLWSWADWDDHGSQPNEEAENKINRALALLVYNYNNLAVVRRVLSRFPYQFYLPGKGFFKKASENGVTYLDSGFLPLLTRLLVLFVVYGVGDRNLLEPVIRDLYVELLQSRNRTRFEYSALWSDDAIEVFSTQRALQALTFYCAYAKGKELVTNGSVRGAAPDTDSLVIENKTGRRITLQIASDEVVETVARPVAESLPARVEFRAETFGEFCAELGIQPDSSPRPEEEGDLLQQATTLGNQIVKAIKREHLAEVEAARLILVSLAKIVKQPRDGKILRDREFQLLTDQFEELKRATAGKHPLAGSGQDSGR